MDALEHLRPPRWWDPKNEGLPRPCTCENGPCDGECGYDPKAWEIVHDLPPPVPLPPSTAINRSCPEHKSGCPPTCWWWDEEA
jgi:hypothetical protein